MFMGLLAIFACGLTVKAANISAEMNTLIYSKGDTNFYLDGNELLKIEVTEVDPIVTNRTYKLAEQTTELTMEKDVVIKYASKELSEDELELVKNASTRSTYLTRTDEAMNPGQNIKATLSVKYDYGGDVFTDGTHISLISATSSYTRIGAIEGISPQSSKLYYNAVGEIYDGSGNFVRNGSLGRNDTISTPTFTNKTLMPSGYVVKYCTDAGVNYTLVCTRGVSITVYMKFV